MASDFARLDRRKLIALAALAALPAEAALALTPAEQQGLDRFTADLAGLDPRADLDAVSQDAHVLRTAAAGVLVETLPAVPLERVAYAPGVETGRVGRFGRCVVIRYRVAEGQGLPPHNHPNYSVATVGLTGESLYEHFTPVGDLPALGAADRFRLRKVGESLLRPGGVVTLAPSRDNIHAFVAGRGGAEFFDIISLHSRDVGFSNIALEAPLAVGEAGNGRWLKV